MTIDRIRFIGLLGTVVALFGGCDSRPPLAPISGVVLLDGMPIEDVVVEFLPDPDKGTHGPRSTGKTDAAGKFQLRCDDGRPGAVIGTHRVLVQDPRSFPPPRLPPGQRVVGAPARVPERYRTAVGTPLRLEIRAGNQTITVEISSKP